MPVFWETLKVPLWLPEHASPCGLQKVVKFLAPWTHIQWEREVQREFASFHRHESSLCKRQWAASARAENGARKKRQTRANLGCHRNGSLAVPVLKFSLRPRSAHRGPGPDSYTGLHHWAPLQLASPAAHLHPNSPRQTPLLCTAQDETLQWQECPLTARGPAAANVP